MHCVFAPWREILLFSASQQKEGKALQGSSSTVFASPSRLLNRYSMLVFVSPPARVTSALRTLGSESVVNKRTDPSTITNCTPPE